MARSHINKFNRGEIDPRALSRDDVEKVNNSGRLMCNFMPVRLGPMVYRPGVGEHLGSVADESYLLPFVAATDDTAVLEFSNNLLRLWVDDALIARTAVTSSITNGEFTSDITGWTTADEGSSSSSWSTLGTLSLLGTGTASAITYQTIASTDTGSAHGIRIVILQAPVRVQIGTSGASSDDIMDEVLKPGTHCLKFTPASNITITFSNSANITAHVDSVAFDAAGTLTMPTEVTTANLPSIRFAQSADVVFCTQGAGQQFVIERRGTESWSIVDYRVDDGPFNVINNTDITLTPSTLSGTGTLTASKDYFASTDVGRLFKLTSSGQDVSANISAEDTGTGSIRVTGVGTSRDFNVVISGLPWVATITLQRSTDDATWVDVETYVNTNQSKVYNDSLDNSVLYYRLYCKTGDYTSGTAVSALSFEGGSIDGIARVITYTSATVVSVQVLSAFGDTDATRNWYAGTWNAGDGYPSAVALFDGRLWFAGKNQTWGSVSDAFYSIDDTLEGNSQRIQKTIGFGPVDKVEWLLPLSRLVMGIASDEIAIRSDSFGATLTQSNTNLRSGSNQGAAPRDGIVINKRGYFVQRSTEKLYGLEYSLDQDGYDSFDLTVLNPSICEGGIKRIAVTMQPEIRIFCVLEDGTARVMLLDASENVRAWSRIETDGLIEDVTVLPDTGEDRVYFVVNRTGGRYLEKMAKFSEAKGGNVSKHFDSFKTYTSPGTTITGLTHLEGKTVHVWADGQYRESATVASGQISVSGSWTSVVVGLRHIADYTASVLKYSDYSVLAYEKRVMTTGFVLEDYWPGSLSVGPSASQLSAFPTTDNGKAALTTIQEMYAEPPFPFNGSNESDPKIHLQANNPVTVQAIIYEVEEQYASASADQR